MKGLPLSYNRDLQEDKEPLFDSVDQTHLALAALTGVVSTVHFDADRMEDAANGSAVAAVDLAEWLVERGMPFRQAHQVVGSLVRDSIERHVPLAELVEATSRARDRGGLLARARGRGDPTDQPRAARDRWRSRSNSNSSCTGSNRIGTASRSRAETTFGELRAKLARCSSWW